MSTRRLSESFSLDHGLFDAPDFILILTYRHPARGHVFCPCVLYSLNPPFGPYRELYNSPFRGAAKYTMETKNENESYYFVVKIEQWTSFYAHKGQVTTPKVDTLDAWD
jgi:hypothetical protein